jgi:hypothetical protein
MQEKTEPENNQKDISEIIRRKPSMQGENNPRWNGGTSEYPDHSLLKKARIEKLKQTKCKCEICDREAFVIHHIDGTKDNHDFQNLIVLCNRCHHVLHTSEEAGKNTSKYLREYGFTLKEIIERTGLDSTTIKKWTKYSIKRQAILDSLQNPAQVEEIIEKAKASLYI